MRRRFIRRSLISATLVPLFLGFGVAAPARATAPRAPASAYAVDLVAPAASGSALNDAGDVAGTSYLDNGCGSTCLPPQDTVVWRGGQRIVLPTVPGLLGIYVSGMNNLGWVTGLAGLPGTITHAVVWKPVGATYQAIDLGTLPGTTVSSATGIDDLGRVVGWSSTLDLIGPSAPFMWTEAGGMVDLSAIGYPDEMPLNISPQGTVATPGFWYRLGDPTSEVAMPAPPAGFFAPGTYATAINDAGDQARFLPATSGENLAYLFRFDHAGTWQLLSPSGTGHLSSYGVGSINATGDVTATVLGSAMVAAGPTGLAMPLAPLVSAAYPATTLTSAGPMNASGVILAGMILGQSQRLVKLVPTGPCSTSCIRVASLQVSATGPTRCDIGGTVQAKTKVTVTDETGAALAGVRVTGHFLDDYWLDQVVVAKTNTLGQATFKHTGPPCIGAISFIVTGAAKPARTWDRTTGVLDGSVIPTPK